MCSACICLCASAFLCVLVASSKRLSRSIADVAAQVYNNKRCCAKMSTLLNRLRRNPKPKPLLKQTPASARCVDSCCYENTVCTVEPITSSSRQSSSTRSSGTGIKDSSGRPILRRSDTFTLKDGPPDELPDHIKYATYRKKNKPTRGVCMSLFFLHLTFIDK